MGVVQVPMRSNIRAFGIGVVGKLEDMVGFGWW